MPNKTQRQQTISNARRALVLDAARAAFAEAGAEGLSLREVARRAGYTPGAIYSYFESKEALQAALVAESVARMEAAVAQARTVKNQPDKTLVAKVHAWFDFYGEHPKEFDLVFGRGGLSEAGATDPLATLRQVCEDALVALGVDPARAAQEGIALLAQGVGVLSLARIGCLRGPRQSADLLFKACVAQWLERVQVDAPVSTAGQADLFGGSF